MAVLDRARDILMVVLDIDDTEIGSHSSFQADLEMDSLQKIEFIARIERSFGQTLDMHDVAGTDSLAALVSLLRDDL
ncbi:acyl carrier protein [Nocardia sp. NBC_01499]|uniref:acyl carrier protein n=1 Tax=Nocardia sp. NBC_01499 TaxID=2903597 RepID=UPI003866E39D